MRQVDEAAIAIREIVATIHPDTVNFKVNVTGLGHLWESVVTIDEGSHVEPFLSDEVTRIALPLKMSMAEEFDKAWITAEFGFYNDGTFTVAFDYDNQPVWFEPVEESIHEENLGIELSQYPRDLREVPLWMMVG